MSSMSNIIEAYLKKILHAKGKNAIEIKRGEIADRFQCVPSQINYVINTRFTAEKGYLVESKRGGGGYIRIIRMQYKDGAQMIDDILDLVGDSLTEQRASQITERLIEEELINEREANLILSAVERETLNIPLPIRDEIRARIFTAMLTTLKYE